MTAPGDPMRPRRRAQETHRGKEGSSQPRQSEKWAQKENARGEEKRKQSLGYMGILCTIFTIFL